MLSLTFLSNISTGRHKSTKISCLQLLYSDFQLVLELTKGCFSTRIFEFICHVWNSVELKQEIKLNKTK